MARSVSVTEAKAHLSELVGRATIGQERFLIRKRGKPVGAIVSPEDLALLEAHDPASRPRGLLAAVGALADFDEFEEAIAEVIRSRSAPDEREVTFK